MLPNCPRVAHPQAFMNPPGTGGRTRRLAPVAFAFLACLTLTLVDRPDAAAAVAGEADGRTAGSARGATTHPHAAASVLPRRSPATLPGGAGQPAGRHPGGAHSLLKSPPGGRPAALGGQGRAPSRSAAGRTESNAISDNKPAGRAEGFGSHRSAPASPALATVPRVSTMRGLRASGSGSVGGPAAGRLAYGTSLDGARVRPRH